MIHFQRYAAISQDSQTDDVATSSVIIHHLLCLAFGRCTGHRLEIEIRYFALVLTHDHHRADCDSTVWETPHECLCCRTQVMHIAAVSEITNLLIPSLKTLHVSSASKSLPFPSAY